MRSRATVTSVTLNLAVVLLGLLLLSTPAYSQAHKISGGSKPPQIRIDGDGDWWSSIRNEGMSNNAMESEPLKPFRRFPSDASFRIAGISIRSADWQAQVRKRFGTATKVQRGDASTSRHQWCYKSETGDQYLIFEVGEATAGFYLLFHPQRWTGEQYCSPSKFVANASHTGSGLRLGMTRKEVAQSLGAPTATKAEYFHYLFEGRHKTTQSEKKRLREGQSMSDTEFEKNYAYIDLSANIDIRFEEDKATLIYVGDTETF